MNYSTLVAAETVAGSIKFRMNWGRLDSAGIVEDAQAWIYNKLRVREMVTTSDVAIAQYATSAACPSRFLDPLHFFIPGYVNRIRLRDLDSFKSLLAYDQDALLPIAVPTRATIEGSTILLNSRSDIAYTAKLTHYQSLAPLAATTNETNFLTDRYPTLLRYACLKFAAEERKDNELIDAYEKRALDAIAEIAVMDDLSMRGQEIDFGWEATDGD